MVNNCPGAPDVSDSRTVVAMVGLDTVWRGEGTPMYCDGECAEWDIRNEFETIDGMPVYYGGELCDSDGSEWDDPWDLAYAEYVDQCNFDAPEGMELKVFERLMTVDDQAMMVSEVPGPRHVSPTGVVRHWKRIWWIRNRRWTFSLRDMMFLESLNIRFTGLPVGLMVMGWPFIMRVISVIQTVGRLEIVRRILGMTGVILLFTMDMVAFLRMRMIHNHWLCSVISYFGMTTLPSRHECCRTVELCQYRHRPFSIVGLVSFRCYIP